MKKVLCDKDGKFISVYDDDYYLEEFNDGDCLTHEDGTIVVYREAGYERGSSKVAYHAFLRNNEVLHIHQNEDPFTHYDHISSYRFSTLGEKKCMNEALSKNGLYYDEKEKCLKKLRWRAVIGNSYYYIDWNRFVICKTTETDSETDNLRYKNLNYFRTKEEANFKLFAVKSVLDD